MKFLLFLLLSFVILSIKSEICLIVGSVEHDEVRILYWANQTRSHEDTWDFTVTVIPNDKEDQQFNLPLISAHGTPEILTIRNLQQQTKYKVTFKGTASEDTHTVTLKTPSKNPKNHEFIFLSCNRLVEDRMDMEMWEILNSKIDNSPDFIGFHLGDQIYADELQRKIQRQFKDTENCISYMDMLDDYRQFYSHSWMQDEVSKFLSKGSHIMLLDDHDIINNLNSDKWRSNFTLIQMLIRAGAQSFLEFQYQLNKDIPSFSFEENSSHYNCCLPTAHHNLTINNNQEVCDITHDFWVDFDGVLENLNLWEAKRMGNVGFLLLETRFTSTFMKGDSVSCIFCDQQLKFIRNTLINWDSDESIDHIIVITSIPLIYQSTFMADIAFIAEHERYSTHRDLINDTSKLLDILFSHHKKIKIISGDIHMYLDSSICNSDNSICIQQIVTSGMSSKSSTLRSLQLYLYAFFAINVFTPIVPSLSSPDSYYHLRIDEVFLDNSFVSVKISEKDWKATATLRELPSHLALLHWIHTHPIIIYFFLGCFVSNITLVLLFFLLRTKESKPKANNELIKKKQQ